MLQQPDCESRKRLENQCLSWSTTKKELPRVDDEGGKRKVESQRTEKREKGVAR